VSRLTRLWLTWFAAGFVVVALAALALAFALDAPGR
jgi:hypothetical protein